MVGARMDKLTLPNALSASRLLLAPLCFTAVTHERWIVAAALLFLAITTDVIDGRLARRRGLVTSFGGLLDHGSDAFFVTLTLAALAVVGLVPWLLPLLVAAAFAQYVLDSRALAGQPLRASRLGRYNGIAYFVLAGAPVVHAALGLELLPAGLFYALGWVLVATTITSMADRVIALFRRTSR
ncbi:MAG: CDP-alcohol phosphatidyltransferase family protein [Gammaproteobacteria bacterium]|nr:CDP-alcohol phosphatidyltransferase family protein [Gammaproteobacteria bacterium]